VTPKFESPDQNGGAAMSDPIHAPIEAHRHAFMAAQEGSENWDMVDAASETLLEVMPSTIEGVIALLLYVHEMNAAHGEGVFPSLDDERFSSRMLAHVASALIRMRSAAR
jgi:hypothetical protein